MLVASVNIGANSVGGVVWGVIFVGNGRVGVVLAWRGMVVAVARAMVAGKLGDAEGVSVGLAGKVANEVGHGAIAPAPVGIVKTLAINSVARANIDKMTGAVFISLIPFLTGGADPEQRQ